MSPDPVAKSVPMGDGATEMTAHTWVSVTHFVNLTFCLLGLTRVLMSLKHQLRHPSIRVPELHAPVLTTRHDPVTIGRQSNTEHEILVAFERLDALAVLHVRAGHPVVVQPPHPDRLVKRARDQMGAVRREGDRVDTVLVALLALGPLDEYAGLRVPDAHALVQATGGDETAVGRDGHRGDAIFDGEVEDALVLLDVPEPDSTIT